MDSKVKCFQNSWQNDESEHIINARYIILHTFRTSISEVLRFASINAENQGKLKVQGRYEVIQFTY